MVLRKHPSLWGSFSRLSKRAAGLEVVIPAGRLAIGRTCPRAQIAQPYLAVAARCCVTEVAGSGGERDITVALAGTPPS